MNIYISRGRHRPAMGANTDLRRHADRPTEQLRERSGAQNGAGHQDLREVEGGADEQTPADGVEADTSAAHSVGQLALAGRNLVFNQGSRQDAEQLGGKDVRPHSWGVSQARRRPGVILAGATPRRPRDAAQPELRSCCRQTTAVPRPGGTPRKKR